jgi:hypothetical protein
VALDKTEQPADGEETRKRGHHNAHQQFRKEAAQLGHGEEVL